MPYEYRRMTPAEREEAVRYRREQGYPLHSPPHPFRGQQCYLVSAANHQQAHIMASPERRAELEGCLLRAPDAVQAGASVPHSWTAAFAALAGLSAAYYLAVGVLLHFLRPDLPPLQSGMSIYAVGPYGWLETSAFVLDALGLAALALALRRAVGPAGRSRGGLALLGLVAVARTLEAVFPTDVPPGPVPRTTAGTLHFLVAFLVFAGIAAAFLLISYGLGADPAWQSFRPVAKGLALAALVALLAFLGLGVAASAFPWARAGVHAAGLVEKAYLVLWHVWVLLTALGLRHFDSQAVRCTIEP